MSAGFRLIIWLDHALTDNGCGKREKDVVNYGAFQCLESERAKIEANIRSMFLKRNTIQENMCQVLRYQIILGFIKCNPFIIPVTLWGCA